MTEKINKPLSASRIKTLETCSWQYWCNYQLKLPDSQNEGSLRGTICHAIFECLGNPRHKSHYNTIIKAQDVRACKPIKRMVESYAVKYGLDDDQNLELIYDMTLEGLNYDFFGTKIGKPTESISEKDFDIEVKDGDKNYRILGFIDKLFLFKKKGLALVRDFKTSKSVFTGKDYTDNMQDYMYNLAVKHLYPDFLERKMEFLFLKFPLNGNGLVQMKQLDDLDLEGFEYFLTEIQSIINDFDETTAMSNLAYNKGYPKPEDGFSGRLVCGRAEEKGELKKDGSLKWHCPFKFAFDYYHLEDANGVFIASSSSKAKLQEKKKSIKGSKIIKKYYAGCPAFQKTKATTSEWDLI